MIRIHTREIHISVRVLYHWLQSSARIVSFGIPGANGEQFLNVNAAIGQLLETENSAPVVSVFPFWRLPQKQYGIAPVSPSWSIGMG